MKVTIDVQPGHQAYMLCYRLADMAQNYLLSAYQWNQKDAVDAQLNADAAFFNTIAKTVAKQVNVTIHPPVEVKK